jgi:molybdopterin-guanine dinucleotide biosynthesis protein A
VPVRVVRDPEPLGGPLVGLLAGLERAAESSVLVAAGDMPALAEDVLAALLGGLGSGEAEAVALVLRGRREPLPVALRTGAATAAARRVLGDGERRLQSLFGTMRVRDLEEAEWRALDPLAMTLRDVDVPADLEGWLET